MSLTTLDPTTALIVVDLQQGILAMAKALPVDVVVERAAALASAFRAQRLPVVLVNVVGGAPGRTEVVRNLGSLPPDWAVIAPALDAHADDILVTKKTWGAFTHTGLEAQLKQRGVTQVVVVGISTSIGVESTARQAYELGFNVSLVTDAIIDTNADAHANSVARIFPRLGETGSSAELLALLAAHTA